ncbi:NUDIX domain-containing protein [Dyella caseinilytica]|nr:NUDIX domain-containing protein [Dyella caseinilytica]
MEAAAHGHSTLGIPASVGKEFVNADKGRKDDAATKDCSGILFRANGPFYLLCKRSDTGQWAQPGGHIEGGESAEEAAVRECVEEIGGCPNGLRWVARRSNLPKGKGTFTCFLQDVTKPFKPELNDEHTKWGWFAPDQLPANTHPEVAKTIRAVTGNELDIAKRIAKGELPSPQRYHNVWLFKLRITGTGTSYRSKHKEFVYRPPENFLTEEFVERCNGLPLIFEHPKESVTLTSDEYRNRAIGTIVLPFIEGDEVDGIAKVFDDDAALLMRMSHASTSPAVVFRDAGSTETVQLDDGSTVLIEGNPSYLDHLAICEEGVWDKGGEPTGVHIEGDPAVDNVEQAPAWADALGKGMKEFQDSVCARLDALEGKGGGESEEEKAKKAAEEEAKRIADEAARGSRADESEEEKLKREEKERADAEEKERKDSEEKEKREKEEKERADAQAGTIKGLEAQIAAMQAQIANVTKPRTNEDRDQLSRIQRRAEGVAMAFGDANSVTPPMFDESPIGYRKRMAAIFQKHSPRAKTTNIKALDDDTFGLIEDMIYADAQASANKSAVLPKGRLHASVDTSTGHRVTTYTGDQEVTWGPFKAPVFSGRINKDVGKRVE